MDKQQFIEKLKQHGAWCSECHDINGEKDRYVKVAKVREWLGQLDEPQKVKVPEFIADWIEEYKKDDRTLYQVMNDIECAVYYHKGKDLAYKWLFSGEEAGEHQKIFATAYYEDYEVEEEPKWVVKDRKGECVYELRLAYTDTTMVNTNKTGIDGLVFTDRTKAEAVATLINGTVEQVEV